MTQKTWFLTGTSRGFGREWAVAALERGDRVAATARDASTLHDLVARYGDAVLPLTLDVTDRAADFAAVQRAHEHFGRLDVVVNNAGYGQFGFVEEFGDNVLPIQLDVTDRAADFAAVAAAFERFGRLDIVVNNAGYGHFGFIEELTEDEIRAQLETNVFGALWVTQAALPFLRQQGSGHILQVSSIGGITAFPMVGAYHASKWALEGFSQALAQEVAPFGIKVTLIEPGPFGTDWSGSSASHSAELEDYREVREHVQEVRRLRMANNSAAPETTVALLAVVDSDDPPLRMFLGKNPLGLAKADYASRIEGWERWQDVAATASN